MGWTAATTKRALADCEAVPVDLDGRAGWVAPGDDAPAPAVGPWVALLPGLDPTTMGWKERDWYLPATCADCFDRMGNAGPTIWVDGQVVGAWVQSPDGEILTRYFVEVPTCRRDEVAQRARELSDLLGDTRFTVRFPSRASAGLLGQVSPRA
jgi:hypothetical protein